MSARLSLCLHHFGRLVLLGILLGGLSPALLANEPGADSNMLAPVVVTSVVPTAGPVTEANPK
ncbi:hypothetical protein, partial [Alcanivorax sp.]|uniref:hypothetical protein n=1 Tax=Alcanivorax sp. TaxID=1872427 RepID=UPI002582CB8D